MSSWNVNPFYVIHHRPSHGARLHEKNIFMLLSTFSEHSSIISTNVPSIVFLYILHTKCIFIIKLWSMEMVPYVTLDSFVGLCLFHSSTIDSPLATGCRTCEYLHHDLWHPLNLQTTNAVNQDLHFSLFPAVSFLRSTCEPLFNTKSFYAFIISLLRQ